MARSKLMNCTSLFWDCFASLAVTVQSLPALSADRLAVKDNITVTI
ncbi:hypothetical protein [Algoriphagus confluentis]